LRAEVADNEGRAYLIHDRDRIFAKHLDDSIRGLGPEVLRSPVARRGGPSPKRLAAQRRLSRSGWPSRSRIGMRCETQPWSLKRKPRWPIRLWHLPSLPRREPTFERILGCAQCACQLAHDGI